MFKTLAGFIQALVISVGLMIGGLTVGAVADGFNGGWLPKSGGTMTGDLIVESGTIATRDGSVTDPIFSRSTIAQTTRSGFFWSTVSSQDALNFERNGTRTFTFNSTSIEAAAAGGSRILNETASDTNPTLIPAREDTNTGVGAVGDDTLSLIAGGVEVLRLSTSGEIIPDGVTAPGTVSGKAIMYIDISDGDFKIRFSDGFVATIAADS